MLQPQKTMAVHQRGNPMWIHLLECSFGNKEQVDIQQLYFKRSEYYFVIFDTVLKVLTNTFDFRIIKVDELPVMTDCIMCNVIRSLINISKRT